MNHELYESYSHIKISKRIKIQQMHWEWHFVRMEDISQQKKCSKTIITESPDRDDQNPGTSNILVLQTRARTLKTVVHGNPL